jgi:hypothetical protein
VRRAFAPPTSAARAARAALVARQPDASPQLSSVGRALFQLLGRDAPPSATVLPPHCSIALRAQIGGARIVVSSLNHTGTRHDDNNDNNNNNNRHATSSSVVELGEVSLHASVTATLDSCRNCSVVDAASAVPAAAASAQASFVYGLARLHSTFDIAVDAPLVRLSNAAVELGRGVLLAAVIDDLALQPGNELVDEARHALVESSRIDGGSSLGTVAVQSALRKATSSRSGRKRVMIDMHPVIMSPPDDNNNDDDDDDDDDDDESIEEELSSESQQALIDDLVDFTIVELDQLLPPERHRAGKASTHDAAGVSPLAPTIRVTNERKFCVFLLKQYCTK